MVGDNEVAWGIMIHEIVHIRWMLDNPILFLWIFPITLRP